MTACEHWFDVASLLYDQKIARPSLWLGDDNLRTQASEKFGQSVCYMYEMVHRPFEISNIDYNGEGIEFFSSPCYLRAKDRCLKMMDRLDLNGAFERKDREVYFHNLLMWTLVKFFKRPPDALIMAEAPHGHAQYLIYEVCKFLLH